MLDRPPTSFAFRFNLWRYNVNWQTRVLYASYQRTAAAGNGGVLKAGHQSHSPLNLSDFVLEPSESSH